MSTNRQRKRRSSGDANRAINVKVGGATCRRTWLGMAVGTVVTAVALAGMTA